MKIGDLPEEARILCERFPSSLATRLVLTTLTKKLCPEFKETKDIGAFLVDVDGLAKPIKILPKFTNQATGRARRNTDGPMVTVNIDVSRLNYGSQSYSEKAYSNNTDYEVPASIVLEGEDAVREWLEENGEIWDNLDYDDFETGDMNQDGYQDEKITINNFDDAESEAQSLLEGENE